MIEDVVSGFSAVVIYTSQIIILSSDLFLYSFIKMVGATGLNIIIITLLLFD